MTQTCRKQAKVYNTVSITKPKEEEEKEERLTANVASNINDDFVRVFRKKLCSNAPQLSWWCSAGSSQCVTDFVNTSWKQRDFERRCAGEGKLLRMFGRDDGLVVDWLDYHGDVF